MAVATYSTDLVQVVAGSLCESGNTVWAKATATGWTNMNIITVAETDYYIQGSACNSATIKTGIGAALCNAGAGITIPTDGAVYCWMYFTSPNCLDSETNGGIRFCIGSALTAFYGYKMGGSDTYLYGGWQCLVCADPSNLTADYTAGSPSSTRQYFGWAYSCPTSVPSKGNPYGVDGLRYGRGTLQTINGQAAAYGTFLDAAASNDSSTNRWGILQLQDGVYKFQGHFLMGTAATAVDFRDSNRSISILNTKKVTANFNLFEVRNASSRVDWTAVSISSLGTVSKGRFLVTNNAIINLTNCTFTDMDTFVFLGGTNANTVTNCVFRRCGIVTQGGASISYCTFDKASGTKAVVVDTPTAITNSSFTSSGTGYAIEGFGTANASYTLTGLTFSGYGSTGTTDAAIHVLATTGTTTINCAGSPTYKSDGATVNIVSGTVDCTVIVKDLATTNAVQYAQVLVWVANGNNKPYNASISITSSGTTATVTHSSHGLSTGDKVIIRGANEDAYNGVFSITYISATQYSYTMPASATSPATGTITATFAVISGTTGADGTLVDSRSWGSNQLVTGWVRKGTTTYTSELYQQQAISGTINSSSGYSTTVQLIRDN